MSIRFNLHNDAQKRNLRQSSNYRTLNSLKMNTCIVLKMIKYFYKVHRLGKCWRRIMHTSFMMYLGVINLPGMLLKWILSVRILLPVSVILSILSVKMMLILINGWRPRRSWSGLSMTRLIIMATKILLSGRMNCCYPPSHLKPAVSAIPVTDFVKTSYN